ncbi:MAG: hypothetical protein IJ685_05360 [Selenomonadaceae bacterium]|nr:hypothetical protein [Selenomonadaceae bacterium]
MSKFTFDLQRFATQEISAGETYELDGVTYTALTDAVFNLDDDEKISGLASGKVQATLTEAENSPTITFDATDGAIDFSATDDDSLAVTLGGRQFKFSEGTATVTSDKVTTGAAKFFIAGTHSRADYEFTVEKSAEFSITSEAFAISSEKFNVAVLMGSNTLNFDVSGTAIRNFTNHTFVLAGGTSVTTTLNDYTLTATTTDEAGGELSLTENGINFKPNADDGKLRVSVTRDGETRTASLDMTGSLTYNLDGSISLTKDTVLKTVFEDGRNLTITAKKDAGGKIFLSPQDGLSVTPATPDALDVLLTIDGKDIIELASVDGTVNYKGGTFTATDGTEIRFVDPSGNYDDNVLRTSGGTTSLHFSTDGIIYQANEGATFVMDYLQGTTWNLQNGAITDYFSGKSQGLLSLSEGSTFKTNDDEFPFALETAGNYTLNGMEITATEDLAEVTMTDYDTITFAADAGINYNDYNFSGNGNVSVSGDEISLSKDATVTFVDDDRTISFTGKDDDAPVNISSDGGKIIVTPNDDGSNFNVTIKDSDTAVLGTDLKLLSGSITFDNDKISIPKGTKISVNRGGQDITFTASEEISASYKVEDGIFYFELDDDKSVDISIASGEQTFLAGDLNLGGVLSFSPKSGTYGLTGGNSSHGNGSNTFAEILFDNGTGIKMSTCDTTIVFVPTVTSDGTIEFNFPNARKHELKFTVSKDGETTFENQLVIDGTVGLNPSTQELSLKKDTVLTLSNGDENSLEVTALDDASGNFSFTDDGIRFAPNAGDGKLELNFVTGDTERSATLDVTAGALLINTDGTFSFDKDTALNLEWEDGTVLNLSSSDAGGSIGFDADGIKVSSDGELSIDLTTATGVQTTLSNLNGTIHYNAGKVLFDADSKLTATSTIGGQPVNITLESNGEGSYIEISAQGTNYVAGTGALSITWERDGKESTFTINSGSVFIGHGIFKIAEGSDVSTDLKDFMPAIYFTTSEAGTYTINGQTITTSAENISMTATDDYMTFKTTDDVVTYDGMTFAGNGNVSLSPDNVVLGANVVANGFGEGKSFVLAEAGNVTADAKIFQLDPLSLDDGREIPMIITVTGAQDGFVFSRTLTTESEEYLGYLDSPYVGSLFTEKFIAAGDSSYRIRTDPIGLEDVIGISDGASISGGATLDDEDTLSYYVLVTDTTGKFTIGKKTYTLAEGTELGTGIRARFDVDSAPYADKINDLNGTVSGDFTGGAVSINGSDKGIQLFGDKDVSVVAGGNSNVELFGLSDGATLASVGSASKIHTDTEGTFTFGATKDDSIAITVTGDDNITFEFSGEYEILSNISNVEGNLQFSEPSNAVMINGIGGMFDGYFSSIGAFDDRIYIHDVADGSELDTEDADKIWLQQTGASMAVNESKFTLTGDNDVWIRDKEVVGLDEGASLTVSDAGNYTVNGQTLTASAGDTFVGLENGTDAYIYNSARPLITKNTSADEIVDHFKPENVSVVSADDNGRFDISLSGGLAIVEDTSARVNITAGDDTVVSQGKNVHLSLTTGGNAWLFPLGGKMTIDNYDFTTRSGFNLNYTDIAAKIKDGTIDFANGELSMGSAVADFGTQSQIVNLYSDRSNTREIVGFAENYASLDASNLTDNLLLSGDVYSTLISGSGNDTIFAAEGNFVDAGAGNNYIELLPANERDESKSGATIDITDGKNTIENFRAGFDGNSDAVVVDPDWEIIFDGSNVSVESSDAGRTVLSEVGDGETFAAVKVVETNGDEYKTFVAQKDSVIAAGNEFANIYTGENSGVDFTGIDDSILVNLTEEAVGTINGEDVYFYGINTVTAGDGLSTLMGSANNETLIAGNGYGSLWGSAGDDKLIGKAGSETKNGRTSFFFFAGDGNDTVSNFEFLTDENKFSGNADMLKVSGTLTNVLLSGDNVVLKFDDENSLTLADANGKNFRYNDLIANVGENLRYNTMANQFVGTGNNATLTVDESAEIWMNNQHGKFYDGNIKMIDASDSTGEMLIAGNELDNTIIAGNGDASLWGGDDGNDLLFGGDGQNTFFYTAGGNGNDTIQNASDGDIVEFTGLTLEQILSTEITSTGVTLNFADGGQLNVESTAQVDFRINGETYAANHDTAQWTKK